VQTSNKFQHQFTTNKTPLSFLFIKYYAKTKMPGGPTIKKIDRKPVFYNNLDFLSDMSNVFLFIAGGLNKTKNI
jgi:hypothetical protein